MINQLPHVYSGWVPGISRGAGGGSTVIRQPPDGMKLPWQAIPSKAAMSPPHPSTHHTDKVSGKEGGSGGGRMCTLDFTKIHDTTPHGNVLEA